MSRSKYKGPFFKVNLKKNKKSAATYTPTLRQNKLKNANFCRAHVPIRDLPVPDS